MVDLSDNFVRVDGSILDDIGPFRYVLNEVYGLHQKN